MTVDAVRQSNVADIFNHAPGLAPSEIPIYTSPKVSVEHEAWEGELLRSGQLTSRRYLRAWDGSWRVIVSAPSPETVQEKLELVYGSQLTLTQLNWTSAQSDDARKEAAAHLDEWGVSALVDGTSGRGLPVLRLAPWELTPSVLHWQRSLPTEAIEVFPFLADAQNQTRFRDPDMVFSHLQ